MKKKTFRRSLILVAVILVTITLTACAIDATVRAEISGDGKEVKVFTTKNCNVDLTVEFSTGETFEQNISLTTSTPTILTFENITSSSFKEYLEENDATISNVSVKNPNDGTTFLSIFLLAMAISGVICFIVDD